MSKIREKESLECGRMHISALKTQKLPGPLSGPWTPAANCSLRLRDSTSLCQQLSASAPEAPPLDQILDPHLEYLSVVLQRGLILVRFRALYLRDSMLLSCTELDI